MNLGRILQSLACPAPTRSPEWARKQYCLETWATRSLSQARALEDLFQPSSSRGLSLR